ncbi:MAG TPA: M20/M25/M40 family metallo-hydrolase [Edaphocola sp.]|nr:M20/M25/M40 family metallo-hydrolase [Edaphocola sp.]
MRFILVSFALLVAISQTFSQNHKQMFEAIYNEGIKDKNLESIAHQLIDVIGPRLVGSPQMQMANAFVVKQYQNWNITAYNEQWGEWRSWQRGFSHIDMIYPRNSTLEATQSAWCPHLKRPIEAEVILIPDAVDSLTFDRMLPLLKGKIVMISPVDFSGRPTQSWEIFQSKEKADSVAQLRMKIKQDWAKRIRNTGFNMRTLPVKLENAGAVGIITSNWPEGWGTTRVFAAYTKRIPSIEMGMEDYSLLARFLENGINPKVKINTTSKWGGNVPVYNTMASIKGREKPDEIVLLSAHLDSWDGGTGATDNGTGTLTMMEAMRILKQVYPNPKRTIMVGHWGSEEQGLNGSRSFTEDHPELLDKISVVFNQDNGTGSINNIATQGFINAYSFFDKWLSLLPEALKGDYKMEYPGYPNVGGSDNFAFIPLGIPAFYLASTKDWNYRTYTWHTQRDTYDKIIFDELRENAIKVAMLVYLACEEPEMISREKIQMPIDLKTGKAEKWPGKGKAKRKGP